jgi:hypothetical protein
MSAEIISHLKNPLSGDAEIWPAILCLEANGFDLRHVQRSLVRLLSEAPGVVEDQFTFQPYAAQKSLLLEIRAAARDQLGLKSLSQRDADLWEWKELELAPWRRRAALSGFPYPRGEDAIARRFQDPFELSRLIGEIENRDPELIPLLRVQIRHNRSVGYDRAKIWPDASSTDYFRDVISHAVEDAEQIQIIDIYGYILRAIELE